MNRREGGTNQAVSADVRHAQPANQVPRLQMRPEEPEVGGDKNGGLSTDRQRTYRSRFSTISDKDKVRSESRLLVCLQISCSSCISLRAQSRPVDTHPITTKPSPNVAGKIDPNPPRTQFKSRSQFCFCPPSHQRPFRAASAKHLLRELG